MTLHFDRIQVFECRSAAVPDEKFMNLVRGKKYSTAVRLWETTLKNDSVFDPVAESYVLAIYAFLVDDPKEFSRQGSPTWSKFLSLREHWYDGAHVFNFELDEKIAREVETFATEYAENFEKINAVGFPEKYGGKRDNVDRRLRFFLNFINPTKHPQRPKVVGDDGEAVEEFLQATRDYVFGSSDLTKVESKDVEDSFLKLTKVEAVSPAVADAHLFFLKRKRLFSKLDERDAEGLTKLVEELRIANDSVARKIGKNETNTEDFQESLHAWIKLNNGLQEYVKKVFERGYVDNLDDDDSVINAYEALNHARGIWDVYQKLVSGNDRDENARRKDLETLERRTAEVEAHANVDPNVVIQLDRDVHKKLGEASAFDARDRATFYPAYEKLTARSENLVRRLGNDVDARLNFARIHANDRWDFFREAIAAVQQRDAVIANQYTAMSLAQVEYDRMTEEAKRLASEAESALEREERIRKEIAEKSRGDAESAAEKSTTVEKEIAYLERASQEEIKFGDWKVYEDHLRKLSDRTDDVVVAAESLRGRLAESDFNALRNRAEKIRKRMVLERNRFETTRAERVAQEKLAEQFSNVVEGIRENLEKKMPEYERLAYDVANFRKFDDVDATMTAERTTRDHVHALGLEEYKLEQSKAYLLSEESKDVCDKTKTAIARVDTQLRQALAAFEAARTVYSGQAEEVRRGVAAVQILITELVQGISDFKNFLDEKAFQALVAKKNETSESVNNMLEGIAIEIPADVRDVAATCAVLMGNVEETFARRAAESRAMNKLATTNEELILRAEKLEREKNQLADQLDVLNSSFESMSVASESSNAPSLASRATSVAASSVSSLPSAARAASVASRTNTSHGPPDPKRLHRLDPESNIYEVDLTGEDRDEEDDDSSASVASTRSSKASSRSNPPPPPPGVTTRARAAAVEFKRNLDFALMRLQEMDSLQQLEDKHLDAILKWTKFSEFFPKTLLYKNASDATRKAKFRAWSKKLKNDGPKRATSADTDPDFKRKYNTLQVLFEKT